MKRSRAFWDFWYDFVVGDDWLLAVGVVVLLVVCAAGVAAGVNDWWLIPLGVPVILALSVVKASNLKRRA